MTYEDVAQAIGVRLCPGPGPDCTLYVREHQRGTVHNHRVHWRDRRLTKSGLRRFLKLVAHTRILNYSSMNKAMRIYSENAWINRMAAETLRVRLPKSDSEIDRLQVRWLMSRGMPVTEAAKRWAHRPL